ncbi:MAG: histidine--tRNA ligase [Candidatus Marinimicrobia bacterium]|nr:histidine--tRNA ligase [Candidatus Neomarinimicrobiota bacterium]
MSKSPIRSVKGTQDILPDQSTRWQDLELTIQKIMDCYGYKEIRTPAFEHSEVFSQGVGEETDIVSKEMYSWTDQGGDNLTLKPELTAPVARSFIQHNLGVQNSINKLYYIDALFRRERPQKGRYRQFHQFGIEVFGSENPETDVEVIALAMHVFHKLGLKELTLQLNSIGSPECRNNYRNAIKNFLAPHFDQLSQTSQDRYNNNPLRILDTKSPDEKEILKDAPNISNYWTIDDKNHFDEVCNLLKHIKIDYQLSPSLVRGLDYYTRTTFEITSNELGAQNAICGGGRYDGLVEKLGGKPTPGIGFAAGIERLLLASSSDNKIRNIQIYIVGIGNDVRPTMINLAEELRSNDIRTSFDYLRRSIKAQMREANKLGAQYAIIIGEDELKDKSVIIKDLSTSNQEKITLDLVQKYMKSLPL